MLALAGIPNSVLAGIALVLFIVAALLYIFGRR